MERSKRWPFYWKVHTFYLSVSVTLSLPSFGTAPAPEPQITHLSKVTLVEKGTAHVLGPVSSSPSLLGRLLALPRPHSISLCPLLSSRGPRSFPAHGLPSKQSVQFEETVLPGCPFPVVPSRLSPPSGPTLDSSSSFWTFSCCSNSCSFLAMEVISSESWNTRPDKGTKFLVPGLERRLRRAGQRGRARRTGPAIPTTANTWVAGAPAALQEAHAGLTAGHEVRGLLREAEGVCVHVCMYAHTHVQGYILPYTHAETKEDTECLPLSLFTFWGWEDRL